MLTLLYLQRFLMLLTIFIWSLYYGSFFDDFSYSVADVKGYDMLSQFINVTCPDNILLSLMNWITIDTKLIFPDTKINSISTLICLPQSDNSRHYKPMTTQHQLSKSIFIQTDRQFIIWLISNQLNSYHRILKIYVKIGIIKWLEAPIIYYKMCLNEL